MIQDNSSEEEDPVQQNILVEEKVTAKVAVMSFLIIKVLYFTGEPHEDIAEFIEMARLAFVPHTSQYPNAEDQESAKRFIMTSKLQGCA